jgi:hypothetical protein
VRVPWGEDRAPALAPHRPHGPFAENGPVRPSGL